MPKVSIVIPCYNAMRYLPETVRSVLAQTYEDYEVLIIDDGSTEYSEAGTLEDWVQALDHPKIRLIRQENLGLAGARNTGIRQSAGDYIALLDADDLWHPTKLEKQVALLDQHPQVGVVYAWSELIDAQGLSTGRVLNPTAEGRIWESLLEQNLIGGGSVPLLRRSCLEQSGLFDLNLRSFVEDWDLWLRLAPLTEFKVVKEILIYYRQLDSSASMDWTRMEQSYLLVLEKAFANAPPALQHKKGKCYGLVNLYLAWRPLKGQSPSPTASWRFLRQAIAQYPQVMSLPEFWRLSLSILLTQCLGGDIYRQGIALTHELRRRLKRLTAPAP
ncbi:MAG: glycosyltransferase family 2 protein [Thermosynechococcaceae cyanobacterium MS004]|nr:glycosyltransferase family 2 protein [Thermosynechococcaceae cyanobacterium MS004]